MAQHDWEDVAGEGYVCVNCGDACRDPGTCVEHAPAQDGEPAGILWDACGSIPVSAVEEKYCVDKGLCYHHAPEYKDAPEGARP